MMGGRGRIPPARGPGPTHGTLFERLGRGIVRHPWYPILFWILLLLISVPAVLSVSSVTTNSATTLPHNTPSVVAQNAMNRLFPNQSSPAATFVLLTGPNITNRSNQGLVVNLSQAIATSPSFPYVASVSSLYRSYAAYLTGEAEIGLGILGPALRSSPSLPQAANQSATFVWGPSALYVSVWYRIVGNGTSPNLANWPAYEETRSLLNASPVAQTILQTFYFGYNATVLGFNATSLQCLATLNMTPCADRTMRQIFPPLLPSLIPSPSNQTLPLLALANLSIENYTEYPAIQAVGSDYLSQASGVPSPWIERLWTAFPNASAPLAEVTRWTAGIAEGTPVSAYPLPVPYSISSAFVSPNDTGTLLVLSFNQSDGYTAPNGATPVFDEVKELPSFVSAFLRAHDPRGTLRYYQTGPSALDQNETSVLNAIIEFILPITVVVLILITILYFRAPLTPVLTFGAIGIALGLGLAVIYVLGRFVTQFDVTSLTLVDTFVLGVGTDYSVFLVARYREELVHGASSDAAVVTTVQWAGESIATSGLTVIVSTLAMAFSGVTLLSQWGIALSVSVLLTLLLALTVTPALLVLLGPRVLWPYTGDRFHRFAHRRRRVLQTGRSYFQRAGRASTRHPGVIIGIIALVSVPLVAIALQVPLSYDFYAQLPSNQPAAQGLQALNEQFGAGYAFPSTILVTLAAPLLVGNGPNAAEFQTVSTLTSLMATTPGVASVDSPTGSGGAPLGTWLNLSSLPIGDQLTLKGMLAGYVGTDHRTVQFTITTTSDGLSNAAVASFNLIENRLASYRTTHGDIQTIYYGGAASVIRDLRSQTGLATQRMAIAATIGLFLVLFLVLGSAVIPPVALGTIGLSIAWSYALIYLLLDVLQGLALFFFVPVILFVLILGLGMDYNVFLLTRVREERLRGGTSADAVVRALTHTGGVISAAAVILASAFLVLGTSDFTLLKAIGLAVGLAVLLDAMVVRTYLVPAALAAGRNGIWWGPRWLRRAPLDADHRAPSPARPSAQDVSPPSHRW
jgi:RND superfamily putative drug exporter